MGMGLLYFGVIYAAKFGAVGFCLGLFTAYVLKQYSGKESGHQVCIIVLGTLLSVSVGFVYGVSAASRAFGIT